MGECFSTTCMRCAVGCGHVIDGSDRGYGLDTVRGDAAYPVNRGLACGRGIRESVDPGGEWLTRPHVRENDTLVRTSWEDALARVVDAVEGAVEQIPTASPSSGAASRPTRRRTPRETRPRRVSAREITTPTRRCAWRVPSRLTTTHSGATRRRRRPTTTYRRPRATSSGVRSRGRAPGPVPLDRRLRGRRREPTRRRRPRSERDGRRRRRAPPSRAGRRSRARPRVSARLAETGPIDHEFVQRSTDGFAALYESTFRPPKRPRKPASRSTPSRHWRAPSSVGLSSTGGRALTRASAARPRPAR